MALSALAPPTENVTLKIDSVQIYINAELLGKASLHVAHSRSVRRLRRGFQFSLMAVQTLETYYLKSGFASSLFSFSGYRGWWSLANLFPSSIPPSTCIAFAETRRLSPTSVCFWWLRVMWLPRPPPSWRVNLPRRRKSPRSMMKRMTTKWPLQKSDSSYRIRRNFRICSITCPIVRYVHTLRGLHVVWALTLSQHSFSI